MDLILKDVRYAVRTLRQSPLFAATVAATMGLGLGLVGSAFTILNAYLLKPIDLPNPRSLYALTWDTDVARRQQFSLADYEALQPEARRFADVAARHEVSVMQDTVSTNGLLVTGNYFEVLGARPTLGRLLRAEDAARRGGEAVVVLSHQAWRTRYGSNAAIVGQRIPLGRQRFEVVGVAEPHADLGGPEDFWAPLTMAAVFPGVDPWSEPDAPSLTVVGRLREEATAASLHAWLEVWLRQRFAPPSERAPAAVRVDSLATRIPLNGVTLTLFLFIMSAFGLVLLVASANVTNLMLARALTRQSEIVVRLALGASRWRVVRQLIIESLTLAVPSAAAGLALVIVATRAFSAAFLATVPTDGISAETILAPLDPDWRVMLFLAATAVLSAGIITVAPAGRLARLRLAQASRGEASPDARGSRLRSGLVAMQIGVCVLFLVGAIGLLNESSRLANPQPNLSYERVALVGVDPTVRVAVAARLTSAPAVERVAVAWKPPMMAGALPTATVRAVATGIALETGYTGVSPEYFALFDMPMVRGRTFTTGEAAGGAAVAIVSEATAAALWPGLDALGQTFEVAARPGRRADPRLPRGRVQVVGVTEDVTNGNIFDGIDSGSIYFPTAVSDVTGMTLLVRARADDIDALQFAVTTAVREIAPDLTFQLYPLRRLVALAVWIFQAFSTAAWVLGLIGLLFAYSGTHAVVSFLVAQRTREFGVRMALGATGWRIVWGMLIDTSRMASIGLGVGLLIAAALLRLFSAAISLVPDFGVSPFVVGTAIVLGATTVAALLPLRRAARIDPAQVLRSA